MKYLSYYACVMIIGIFRDVNGDEPDPPQRTCLKLNAVKTLGDFEEKMIENMV